MYVVVLLMAPALAAPFNPDRPGYADATGTVPVGHLMTELGAQLTLQDGASAIDVPQLLVRGGLTGWLDLRVAAPNVTVPTGDGTAIAGAPSIGLGYGTTLGEGTAFSVIGMMPVAAGPLEQALGDPRVSANANQAVGEIGLTANAALTAGDQLGWAASFAAGYRVFYAQAALEGVGDALSPLAGVGAALMPTDDVQVDVFVDARPADGSVSVGAGVARQW